MESLLYALGGKLIQHLVQRAANQVHRAFIQGLKAPGELQALAISYSEDGDTPLLWSWN